MSLATATTPSSDGSDLLWRSLWFFSIYRLAIAILFLAVALLFGDTTSLGTQDNTLFGRIATAYLLAGLGFLVALLIWSERFNLQLSVQVAVDILALTIMMFASGGQKSGIAVLILVVVAAAGLVGQGRMTLFYAALASVAMLLEESWRALTREAELADFARTGMICIAFFGTAVVARLLARRVVANENLARERGRLLDDQLRISQRIIRDMDDGVLVVDGDGMLRLHNPRAEELLGIGLREPNALGAVPSELSGRFERWRSNATPTVEMLYSKDRRPLRVRFLPASEAGGQSLLYLEDMERVQEQAQQIKLAALGRLTANLAHEIRNPLAAISHAAELLAEEDRDPLHQRLGRIIHDNTQRLNRMVTEVLELGRRDRAQPETLHWSVFLAGFLDELALHDPSSARRVMVGDVDAELQFDRGHLYRVLWNLLVNALRHATAADGSVRLEMAPTPIDGKVDIRVSDDGAGVDEGSRGQVFEPFFTTHGAGTGLGLYIARELCEANGASLELLDEGPGARFRIRADGRIMS